MLTVFLIYYKKSLSLNSSYSPSSGQISNNNKFLRDRYVLFSTYFFNTKRASLTLTSDRMPPTILGIHMDTLELQINEEFKNLIPPLTEEEFKQLEQNCLTDGIRDPLSVWNGFLIDGHNRYEIACKHDLEFTLIEPQGIKTEEDAKLWMCYNQKGRRNLPKAALIELGLNVVAPILQERAKENSQRSGRDYGNGNSKGLRNSVNPIEPINTIKSVADFAECNKSTVTDYKKAISARPDMKHDLVSGKISINKVATEVRKKEKQDKLEVKKEELTRTLKTEIDVSPILFHKSFSELMDEIDNDSIDLLITDPPYATDIEGIETFVNDWISKVLPKIRDDGRAYICTGAYPNEILAYLNAFKSQERFVVDNPLIWTYRNTLGVTPKMKYNLNYQMIWHLYSEDSRELDTSITNEMFSVQDINAPDGRLGDRFHTWQKPNELGLRLIRHSTKEGDSVLDCFACTGTFPLMAAKLKRTAIGCDISKDNLLIAQERGCDVRF